VRIGCALLAAVATALAEVSGTVTNQTSGMPQQGATVTLYKLASETGLDALRSVKSGADGAFTMPDTPTGPHLVQTAFDGVTYNHMLPPGRPTTGLRLNVYNATNKPGGAKIATHMVLFEADGVQLQVSESVIFKNEGKTSYNDPDNGTFRFFLPVNAGGKVKVMGTAPQGMPIERAPKKTALANVYAVDFPVKPGETRIDLNYSMPMTGPGEIAGKVLHADTPVRVVVPVGLTATSAELKLLGQEPATQAGIYEVVGKEYRVALAGTGTLRQPEGPDEDEGAGIRQIRPRLYDRFLPVLGLVATILALGLVLLSRKRV
jgi:hypothetical protein